MVFGKGWREMAERRFTMEVEEWGNFQAEEQHGPTGGFVVLWFCDWCLERGGNLVSRL
jgi:hypothetical protein